MGQENRRVKKIAIPTIAAATGIAILFGVYIIYIASLGNLQLEPHCGKLDLPRFVDVNEPNALSLNPKTQDVYVASSTGSISVISCKEYQNSEVRNLGSLNSGTYAFAQDDDLVYVANSKNNTISVYNWTDSRNSVKTENVGSGPTGIAVDNSTHLVYVANSKDNTISVYNSKNDTVKAVNVGLGPTSIAVDPVTHLVYVANSKDNTISVYNSKDGSVETVKVGLEPTGIAVNPVTHLVYVAIGNNSDTILVIDGKDKRHIKPIRNVTVGPNKIGIPKSISIDEKKNIIYVANNKSNTISVIDGGNNTIINTINTLNISPADIEIDPKLNALYIATKDLKSGQVILINNPASYRPHIGFSLVQVGKEPTGIAVDNSTHLVYVANSKDNTISVYNSKNDTVKTRKVGLGPTSIAVDPVTHLVYVANSKDNTISVYNSKDGSVETVKVGANSSTQVTGNTLNNIYGNATGEGGPTSIAVNPSTHLVYVANSEDNTISVIHRNKNNTLVEEKARIKVGSHPEQIVVDAKKDLVYVSNSEGDTISIIGVRDNKSNFLGSIFSSDDPIGLALDSTNNKLIVANNRLNTISIIQLSPGIETASYLPYLLTRVQGAPETQASKQASKQGAPEIGDQDSKLGEVRSIISLPSGGHPHSIAMDKNILYVTNSAHNTILIKNMSKESLEEEQMSAFKFGQMGR